MQQIRIDGNVIPNYVSRGEYYEEIDPTHNKDGKYLVKIQFQCHHRQRNPFLPRTGLNESYARYNILSTVTGLEGYNAAQPSTGIISKDQKYI